MKACFVFLFSLLTFPAFAKTVRYELTATRGSINLSGKKEVSFALMYNNSIPAPVLEFTEGDDAEIQVTNHIPNEEVSVHWHGILLPPEMDGVPYLNTPPIKPGQSHTFKFRVRQHGTYWYHSHTNVQEQKGLYGAIVIHPKKSSMKVDRDIVAVISDWSDENASQILKNLKKDGDYYLYKKNTMRSLWGALNAGALGTYLHNELTRMGGMDLSDVGYDAFLINGKREHQIAEASAGEKIRLRLINAAASTYFYVSLGQTPTKVISADGVDVQPISAKEILMGMAETYDILFEVPENKNYELLVQAQDGTGSASAWIGKGERVNAPRRPPLNLYAPMDHSQHDPNKHHHTHHHHVKPTQEDSAKILQTLTVDHLRAPSPTNFIAAHNVHELRLELGGDMERYVWHINGKAIHQERNIIINENDIIKIQFVNNTMMHHPMHLHGHFFRVLNQGKELSPLKHTVDVSPHSQRTIEFLANEPGEWMLHCHNLYHMKSGMGRVFKYATFTPRKDIQDLQKSDPHHHDHFYHTGLLEAATNHGKAQLKMSRTWDVFETKIETREESQQHWEWEGDLFYRRYFSQFFNLILGGTHFSDTTRTVVGFGYVLPFLIETQVLLDHEGEWRLDVEKKIQWTERFVSHVDFTFRQNKKTEFEISLMYAPNWHWATGLMLTEEKLGAGLEYRF